MVPPRPGAWAGLAATGTWVALYAVAATAMASGPGYDPNRIWLSDLGHPQAAAPWAFNAACIAAGLLYVPFVLALAATIPGRPSKVLRPIMVVMAVGLILVGVFPEESPYGLHGIVSALFFILLTVTMGSLAAVWFRMADIKLLGLVSAGAFAVGFIFVVTFIAWDAVAPPWEHLAVFAGLVWQVATGLHMLRSPATTTGGAPASAHAP